MHHWNYRIICNNNQYYIGEVYYDENNKPFAITTDPVKLYEFSLNDLLEDFDNVKKAFELPVFYPNKELPK